MPACRLLTTLLFLLSAWAAAAQDAGVLHSLDVVRRLSRERLATRPAVEVEGIVLSLLPGKPLNLQLYQDGTSLYISAAAAASRGVDVQPWFKLKPGDRVRLQGHAQAGHFAPTIDPDTIDRLGGGPLPEPRPITAADLITGQLDGQWVAVSGVVHALKDPGQKWMPWLYEVGSAHGEFSAKIDKPGTDSLVGCRVTMRGICMPYFNFRGQMLGLVVRIRDVEDITVIQPAVADPFSVPAISTGTMRGFDVEQGTDSNRRRLTGTVTFVEPGSHIFLQADNRGVRVGLADGQSAAVGDLVEASGFVRMNGSFAELTYALLRHMGTTPLPVPEPITASATTLSSILSPSFYQSVPPPPDVHCRLVILRGKLLKADSDPGGRPTLWVETAGSPPLNVPVTVPADVIPPRDGSEVEMQGVCELIMANQDPMDAITAPTGLRLFLADGRDLQVIKAASWWTPARQWMLVGGIAAAFGLTLLQVRSLRHRVRVGATALADAIVHRRAAEVRAEERQRLAEEVHGIMAQSLTGVALQLGAAALARTAAPEEVPRHLKLASSLLDFARDEIRRTLLDLRSGLLDKGDLTSALREMAEMFTQSGTCAVEWKITGTIASVHPLAAHSLLRVIQEGLTNSQKHGQATLIDIHLDYSGRAILLTIKDNGQGSSPSGRLGPADGHFGLESMRGRIRRLGGDFKFTSTPGKGALVQAHIPLVPASATTPLNPGPRPPVIPPGSLAPRP